MTLRFPVFLAAVATLCLSARAAERNVWPFWVEQADEATGTRDWQAAGPLFFQKVNGPGDEVRGFRPFYLRRESGDRVQSSAFYPFFTWEERPGFSSFSFFQLINTRRVSEAERATTRGFDVWPVYFSRDTGDPATSYRAVFPIAGTLKNRLGYQRLGWVAFPLYVRSVKNNDLRTTYTPWPIIRRIDGDGHEGLEVWPVYGKRERADDYRKQFWLWPLFYKHETKLDEAVPDMKVGALPFYTRETGAGYESATFVWPFFGYTHRTEPARYNETRYLWPLLVQGRGEQKHVNRWAPLYTHSVNKGYEKTWVLWPLWRSARWEDPGIAQKRDQLLFFVWWSLEQRSLTNPDAAPASKRHLWPLLSTWDNGAGRRQIQVLSPFEVFFPHNDSMRQLYSPLVALWRYDERGPDERQWSLLWKAVTWQRTPAGREFHLGPLLSWRRGPGQTRVALGRGLLGFSREPGRRGWRPFVFDFKRSPDTKTVASAPASP